MTFPDHDYTKFRPCADCQHGAQEINWAAPLLVCRAPPVLSAHKVAAGDDHGIACNVARSSLGNCGEIGRHFKARARS